jgi:hypothetical protein
MMKGSAESFKKRAEEIMGRGRDARDGKNGRDASLSAISLGEAFSIAPGEAFLEDERDLGGPLFISTLTGTPLEALTPGYLRDQIVSPVLFSKALGLMSERVGLALEAGPSGTLTTLSNNSGMIKAIGSQSPHGEWLISFLEAASKLYLECFDFDYEALFAPLGGFKRTSLPLYPFQRESYWMAPEEPELFVRTLKGEGKEPWDSLGEPGMANAGTGVRCGTLGAARSRAPRMDSAFLGRRILSPAVPEDSRVYEALYKEGFPGFIWEHVLLGEAICPAAGYLSMAIEAGFKIFGAFPLEIRDATFGKPLRLGKGETRWTQVIVTPISPKNGEGKAYAFKVASRGEEEEVFLIHAEGTLSMGSLEEEGRDLRLWGGEGDIGGWEDFIGEGRLGMEESSSPLSSSTSSSSFRLMPPEQYYGKFLSSGYDLGEGFRRIKAIMLRDKEARTRIDSSVDPRSLGEIIYPGVLDSVLQCIMPSLIYDAESLMAEKGGIFVPFHLDSMEIWGRTPDELFCQGTGTLSQGGSMENIHTSITAYDNKGKKLLALNGLTLRLIKREALKGGLWKEGLLYKESYKPVIGLLGPKGYEELWGLGRGNDLPIELPGGLRLFTGEKGTRVLAVPPLG